MRKLLVVLAFGLFWVGRSEAGEVRGAKSSYALNYTTTITTVTTGATVLYSVVLSTPQTAGDYAVIWDSATVTGPLTSTTGLKYKLVPSTTVSGANNIVFNPPLQLYKGLCVANSAAALTSLWVYEKGLLPQGY